MFKLVYYHSCEPKFDQYIYRLIDSDFEVDIIVKRLVNSAELPVISEIAKEYEKRKLNVAANLALYYKWLLEWSDWDLRRNVEWNKKNWMSFSPEEFYGKYLTDIKKYMALL